MRSSNADRFNHDTHAVKYDSNVRNESNPIRTGYDALLTWVAEQVPRQSEIIELGCGTGNLTIRIEAPSKVICIDVSEKMIAIARPKLARIPALFVRADLLECWGGLPSVDAIVSTYAVHHLTATEKKLLFERIHDHLHPGGIAVFGDLMFATRASEQTICQQYILSGRQNLVDDIHDEFFWYLEEATEQLQRLGFKTTFERFSELSWGVTAQKPRASI